MHETDYKKAAITLLKRKGYDIVDDDLDGVIVAKDGEGLVFVEVKGREYDGGGFASEPMPLEEAERNAIRFFSDRRYDETRFRFDFMAIIVLGEDKALVRHETNVYFSGKTEDETDEPLL